MIIKYIIKVLYACAFVCVAVSAISHEIHISYSRIHVSDSSIVVVSKLYVHDFDYALFDVPKDCPTYKDSLQTRFLNQFEVCVDSANVNFCFDSIAIRDDMYWLYLHAVLPKKQGVLSVSNTLMCSLFNEQKNLCVVSVGKSEEGYVLDCENKKIHVTLQ